MIALALRIIFHQPLRYAVALMGISVAAGLAFIQLGLYLGFKQNASIVVDHTDGDVWVCARFQENFDFPKILNSNVLNTVRSTRGIKSAHPMLIVFSKWKLKSGAEKTVQIVGYDVDHGVGKPWNLLYGFPDELDEPGAISVDTTALRKLDNADVGSSTEIGAVTANVVAVTDGIRSFQGNPMIFTDLNNARSFARMNSDAIHYIICKLEMGADRAEVINTLRTIGDTEYFEAYAKEEFSKKAQDYWLNATGAGPALAMAALMGLVVGVVVAGQVLYTSTLEHIKEYGTLKAIGASNLQVSGAIVSQAIVGALPAHCIAGGLLLIAGQYIGGKGIHLSIDFNTYMFLGFMTVLVCIAASMLSVWRVTRVEPAEVFKG
ncbi:MAG TPA: FtsX-like permease family protein [Planctomycetota bacterium]|nr:FtsX-like permease family protein [Planctomycetota bacterium]